MKLNSVTFIFPPGFGFSCERVECSGRLFNVGDEVILEGYTTVFKVAKVSHQIHIYDTIGDSLHHMAMNVFLEVSK